MKQLKNTKLSTEQYEQLTRLCVEMLIVKNIIQNQDLALEELIGFAEKTNHLIKMKEFIIN